MWIRMVHLGPIVIVVKADANFFGVGAELFWASPAISVLIGPVVVSVTRTPEARS